MAAAELTNGKLRNLELRKSAQHCLLPIYERQKGKLLFGVRKWEKKGKGEEAPVSKLKKSKEH